MFRLSRWLVASVIATSVNSILTGASAMSVNPIVIDLEASGRGAVSQVNVTNTQAGDLPVELQVSRVSVTEAGEIETTLGGDENFLIFPPQALIPPGQTQVFRVQWVGSPALEQSETYLVTVAQLPVELGDEVSGIQLLYNFQVVASVAPSNGVADLKLESAQIVTDEDGVSHPALQLRNDGNAHAYLSRAKVRIDQEDSSGKRVWSQTLEPEDISQSVGVGLVQPGRQRRIVLPFDLPTSDGHLTATLRYEDR